MFGPEIPLLISDDWSQRSVEIRDVAERLDTYHLCGGPRGHFAGDLNSTCAALAFAESQNAEICLKVSQRLVLCEPAVREILENYFADPQIWMVMPARIHPGSIKRAESRFFANLAVLTDVIAVRTGKLTAEALKTLYEERVRTQRKRFDTLVESCFAYIEDVVLAGHVLRAPELSRPKLFLRKCQSEPADYLILAAELGMVWRGHPPLLQEWRYLENAYRPVPSFA